jgi:hypothetical protein
MRTMAGSLYEVDPEYAYSQYSIVAPGKMSDDPVGRDVYRPIPICSISRYDHAPFASSLSIGSLLTCLIQVAVFQSSGNQVFILACIFHLDIVLASVSSQSGHRRCGYSRSFRSSRKADRRSELLARDQQRDRSLAGGDDGNLGADSSIGRDSSPKDSLSGIRSYNFRTSSGRHRSVTQ